jgi:hypothetical protein
MLATPGDDLSMEACLLARQNEKTHAYAIRLRLRLRLSKSN